MYLKQKYIVTKNNVIIVFPELLQHSDFKNFEPISAGFMSIGTKTVDSYPELDCSCYGESISLNLKSNPIKDTELAKKQILNIF